VAPEQKTPFLTETETTKNDPKTEKGVGTIEEIGTGVATNSILLSLPRKKTISHRDSKTTRVATLRHEIDKVPTPASIHPSEPKVIPFVEDLDDDSNDIPF